MISTRSFLVRDFSEALAVLSAAVSRGTPPLLLSAPGCAAREGAPWFLEMVAEARREKGAAEARAVVDCGDDAGRAMEALALKPHAIVFHGPEKTAAKLAAIAEAGGSALYRRRPPTHELPQAPAARTAFLADLEWS